MMNSTLFFQQLFGLAGARLQDYKIGYVLGADSVLYGIFIKKTKWAETVELIRKAALSNRYTTTRPPYIEERGFSNFGFLNKLKDTDIAPVVYNTENISDTVGSSDLYNGYVMYFNSRFAKMGRSLLKQMELAENNGVESAMIDVRWHK